MHVRVSDADSTGLPAFTSPPPQLAVQLAFVLTILDTAKRGGSCGCDSQMIVLIGSVAAEEREEISVSSANWVADLGASRFEVHWDATGLACCGFGASPWLQSGWRAGGHRMRSRCIEVLQS